MTKADNFAVNNAARLVRQMSKTAAELIPLSDDANAKLTLWLAQWVKDLKQIQTELRGIKKRQRKRKARRAERLKRRAQP